MKLARIIGDDKTEPVSTLYLDGYDVGKNRLKGVVIGVSLDENQNLVIDADWPENYNTEYFINQTMKYIQPPNDPMLFTDSGLHGDDDGIILE